jgi:hypothetical protein
VLPVIITSFHTSLSLLVFQAFRSIGNKDTGGPSGKRDERDIIIRKTVQVIEVRDTFFFNFPFLKKK